MIYQQNYYHFQIWVQNVGCECILGNHLRYLILLVSSRNLHFSCPKKIVMAILGSDAVRSRVFWLNCSEFFNRKGHTSVYNGTLFPKLFWPTVRKNCSSDQNKLLDSRLKAKNLQNKFEINIEPFIQRTVKWQCIQFLKQNAF